MNQKKFIKNNEGFICINCKKKVEPHPTSSRDHCNACLYGLHVDVYPGDRANNCKGILQPISLEIANGKEKIVYSCQTCKKEIKCIKAPDDDIMVLFS